MEYDGGRDGLIAGMGMSYDEETTAFDFLLYNLVYPPPCMMPAEQSPRIATTTYPGHLTS